MRKHTFGVAIACVGFWVFISQARAQEPVKTRRVLMMYWGDRDYPGTVDFDRLFQADLQAAALGPVEFYSEYLDTDRFPGDAAATIQRNYMRQKYAGRPIDVVVTNASPSLDFLLKYRRELFPTTPLVFAATHSLTSAQLSSGGGATGILYVNSYRRNIELALKLHPRTNHIFVVSSAQPVDESWERMARNDLQGFTTAAVTYLTDLPLDELTGRLETLPERSLVLYVWQRARNREGKLLESQEVLSMIAPHVHVPIYGMSFANIGLGIVGGSVWTRESVAAKLADLIARVLNGARASEIPVENAPQVPMFDWRQLQRWGIAERELPPDSIIRFREVTVWQVYKWRILGVAFLFFLQAVLITSLLLERRRSRRTQEELKEYREHLERLVMDRTAELVVARDEALAASRSKTRFLANMSHELRTPLNAILGFSGLVRSEARLSDEHRKYLKIVGTSGEHLLDLIDEVLDMAKIETGNTVIDSSSFDLHALTSEVVAMLQQRALVKNVRLQLSISSSVPQFVQSDAGKLRQVLTNLVGNAVKYTDEGSVTVRLDSRPQENLRGHLLIFEVEDTGVGISVEDQTRIFDPFVQAGHSEIRQGTGLGLSISRQFVQLLGGSIRLKSTPGRGSHFRIEVPVQFADASAVPPATKEALSLQPGQPEYRILIVEDQPENWLLLEQLLKSVGFQVRVAHEGTEAIECFKEWHPHFIWMDLRLPEISGFDAARRIRDLEGGQATKIVAITASVFTSQREEVLAAGFNDFLRKPYRPNEIFDCMARLLGVRYRYRESSRAPSEPGFLTLNPTEIAEIPVVLRDQLEAAALSLDRERVARVAAEIAKHNPPVGTTLMRLSSELAYSPILRAIEAYKKRLSQVNS